MTRYAPLWQQAGTYPAQLDRYLISSLWPAGGALGAVATAVANTMQISVAPGSAAVPLQAGQGAALCHWDTPEVLTLTAAPPSGQSRVDLIVCQVRDHDLDGGSNNDFIITTVAGTPATTATGRPGDKEDVSAEQQAAVTPAVPANAMVLATVSVPGAAANLNNAAIVAGAYPLGPTGRLLAFKNIVAPGYNTQAAAPVCIDPVNVVLKFVVPPNGRVLLEHSSLLNIDRSGVRGSFRWSKGTVDNVGIISSSMSSGNIDNSSYRNFRCVVGLTPGEPVVLALQWFVYNTAGLLVIGNATDDLTLTATELP